MTLSALGIFSAAGAGGVAAGAYELIRSEILGSAQSSVIFSSLATHASTYKHLQIRAVGRVLNAGGGNSGDAIRVRFNGDTGSNYAVHQLIGDGSTVSSNGSSSQTGVLAQRFSDGAQAANIFGSFVADILDVYSTTKNKTFRSIGGTSTGPALIILNSGVHLSTASMTSITLLPATGSDFAIGSRFSLYGIKG